MFWSKAKHLLKDKEAGLIFNWRNSYPLKYPLTLFLLLSLIAHFFFLQIFRIPEQEHAFHSGKTGTLFLLSETSNPETHRLLAYAESLGIAALRAAPEIDPLTRGIDDQLYFHLTAGLYNWQPKARPYPITTFDETGAADLTWEYALPPVNKTFLQQAPKHSPNPPSYSQIKVADISPELEKLLPAKPHMGEFPLALADESVSYTVMIDRTGSVLLLTPLNKSGESKDASQAGEQWIRSLLWQPSLNGGEGIISLIWEDKHD